MDEVFAQSSRLFRMPLTEKMKLLRNAKQRGYTPVLDEALDRENQFQGLSSLPTVSLSLLILVFPSGLF